MEQELEDYGEPDREPPAQLSLALRFLLVGTAFLVAAGSVFGVALLLSKNP